MYNTFQAGNRSTFKEIENYKFNKGIVLKVPLHCGLATTIGRVALGIVTLGSRKKFQL